MTKRGRRSRRKPDRKDEAETAIRNLSHALERSIGERVDLANSAARQILAMERSME